MSSGVVRTRVSLLRFTPTGNILGKRVQVLTDDMVSRTFDLANASFKSQQHHYIEDGKLPLVDIFQLPDGTYGTQEELSAGKRVPDLTSDAQGTQYLESLALFHGRFNPKGENDVGANHLRGNKIPIRHGVGFSLNTITVEPGGSKGRSIIPVCSVTVYWTSDKAFLDMYAYFDNDPRFVELRKSRHINREAPLAGVTGTLNMSVLQLFELARALDVPVTVASGGLRVEMAGSGSGKPTAEYTISFRRKDKGVTTRKGKTGFDTDAQVVSVLSFLSIQRDLGLLTLSGIAPCFVSMNHGVGGLERELSEFTFLELSGKGK